MADRKNLLSRLYDEAQDEDPEVALEAIRQIHKAQRLEDIVVTRVRPELRERGYTTAEISRYLGDALGGFGDRYRGKAAFLEMGERERRNT